MGWVDGNTILNSIGIQLKIVVASNGFTYMVFRMTVIPMTPTCSPSLVVKMAWSPIDGTSGARSALPAWGTMFAPKTLGISSHFVFPFVSVSNACKKFASTASPLSNYPRTMQWADSTQEKTTRSEWSSVPNEHKSNVDCPENRHHTSWFPMANASKHTWLIIVASASPLKIVKKLFVGAKRKKGRSMF